MPLAKAVSRHPLATEARVLSQTIPAGVNDGQIGTGKSFYVITVSFIPP